MDDVKFPKGLNNLIDYVHNIGLKFGLSSSAGNYSCSNSQAGSFLHESNDALLFEKW